MSKGRIYGNSYSFYVKKGNFGINKSTLWYIKKNLSEDKMPKIYKKFFEKFNRFN